MARILITGGAGFVGSHLTVASVAAGHEVHVVARRTSDISRLEQLGGRVSLHRFDLRADERLRQCLADIRPEIVFHLAASPRRQERAGLEDVSEFVGEDLESLVLLLRRSAETAQPPVAVIRTGSLAEYGTAPVPHREEQREAPVTAYSAALVAATQLVAGMQPRLPFPVTTARLALVYGPMQSDSYFVPQLISRCLAGKPVTVERPDDRRDFIFVGDVVDALLRLAASSHGRGRIINVSSGVAPSMRDVARMVIRLTCAAPDRVTYSRTGRSSGAAHLCSSPELAHKLLGWRARTPLFEGLSRTIRWQRDVLGTAPALQPDFPDLRREAAGGRGIVHA